MLTTQLYARRASWRPDATVIQEREVSAHTSHLSHDHRASGRPAALFSSKAKYIAWPLLLVVLSSSVGNLVVLGLVRSLWWNMGIQLGRSQPRAGLVENIPATERHSLRLLTCQSERKKGKQESKLLPEHVTPQSKRFSRHVSEIKRGLLE